MSTSNRRQPTRLVRTSTTRPSNYYARPYGFPGAPNAAVENDVPDNLAPGFFPAITHFTDGLAALPKEVMRHFTLLRETEGKALAPDQAIAELVRAIKKLPDPPKQQYHGHTQAYLRFSLNNSVNASANGSMIDGHLPAPLLASRPESSDSSGLPLLPDQHSETRKTAFHLLREKLREMNNVLDEKNMVLTTANETLAKELARLDNTLPYVEKEISEEARLGSNTHWALPHMKDLRKAAGVSTLERSRREIAAANSLAAAAIAVTEHDLAANRSEVRREAVQAKRKNQNVDSDFDDRPGAKKVQSSTKIRKVQETVPAADGKATPHIAAPAQVNKRRRIEKPSAPAMERQLSGVANAKSTAGRDGGMVGRENNNAGDASRKKAKPLPVPALARKKNIANSPSVVSSPTRGTFPTTTNRDYSPAPVTQRERVAASRVRQNSMQSIKSTAPERPRTATSTIANGKSSVATKANTPDLKTAAEMTGRTLPEARAALTDSYKNSYGEQTIEEEGVAGALVMTTASEIKETKEAKAPSSLKREETEPADGEELGSQSRPELDRTPVTSVPMAITRSRNGISRPSVPATPVTSVTPETVAVAAAPPLSRSRSMRGAHSMNSAATAASSPALGTAASPRRSHKRGANMHNQNIASPSRSSDSSGNSGHATPQINRNNLPATANVPRTATVAAPPKPRSRSASSGISSAEEDVGGEGPSSPASDEPRYCVCGQVSYGDMIACDNDGCPREWFHLQCVGLTKPPGSKAKWYCDECKEVLKRGGRAVV